MFDSTFLANDKNAEGSKIDDGCISNFNSTHPTERDFSKVKSIAHIAVVSPLALTAKGLKWRKRSVFCLIGAQATTDARYLTEDTSAPEVTKGELGKNAEAQEKEERTGEE
jgi:hypothetical protein